MNWLAAVGMFVLAMGSVGLWTLRVALAARGCRLAGAVVAAVEAVVFALAFSSLVADLASFERIAGYATGVAVGTVAGLAVNERLRPGAAVVEIVVPGTGEEVLDALRHHGWPATAIPACGVRGPAAVLLLVVHANRAREVVEVVRTTTPYALWTIRPATAAHGIPGMATSVTV